MDGWMLMMSLVEAEGCEGLESVDMEEEMIIQHVP